MAIDVAVRNGIRLENRASLFTLTAPVYLSEYAIAPYKKVLSQQEKDEIMARSEEEGNVGGEEKTEGSEGSCVLQ
jgi:hypothetical protein